MIANDDFWNDGSQKFEPGAIEQFEIRRVLGVAPIAPWFGFTNLQIAIRMTPDPH